MLTYIIRQNYNSMYYTDYGLLGAVTEWIDFTVVFRCQKNSCLGLGAWTANCTGRRLNVCYRFRLRGQWVELIKSFRRIRNMPRWENFSYSLWKSRATLVAVSSSRLSLSCSCSCWSSFFFIILVVLEWSVEFAPPSRKLSERAQPRWNTVSNSKEWLTFALDPIRPSSSGVAYSVNW